MIVMMMMMMMANVVNAATYREISTVRKNDATAFGFSSAVSEDGTYAVIGTRS